MSLSLTDLLAIAAIAAAVIVPSVLYIKRKVDTLTSNHLAHLDNSIQTLDGKVDTLAADLKLFIGRWEGYELPDRVTRLERASSWHADE